MKKEALPVSTAIQLIRRLRSYVQHTKTVTESMNLKSAGNDARTSLYAAHNEHAPRLETQSVLKKGILASVPWNALCGVSGFAAVSDTFLM